jgi:gliding motility-associated-like protein
MICLNDIFQPKGIGIQKYQLDIFDRWGERIFSSSDFLKGWDGTYKGSLC